MKSLSDIVQKLDQVTSGLEAQWADLKNARLSPRLQEEKGALARETSHAGFDFQSDTLAKASPHGLTLEHEEFAAKALEAEAAQSEIKLLKQRNKIAVKKIDLALSALAGLQSRIAEPSLDSQTKPTDDTSASDLTRHQSILDSHVEQHATSQLAPTSERKPR